METVPKLIRHIEKMEVDEEIEDEQEGDGGAVVAEEDVGGGQTANKGAAIATADISGGQMADRGDEPHKEATKQTDKIKKMDETENPKKKPRSTQLVSRLRDERQQAKIKEQDRRWKEATEKGLGENPAGELDMEDAMMSPEEEEKQPEGEI